MKFEGMIPVRIYCANCGAKVMGYKSADGALRVDCPRCMAKIFSKQKSRREIDIKMTAPNQQFNTT